MSFLFATPAPTKAPQELPAKADEKTLAAQQSVLSKTVQRSFRMMARRIGRPGRSNDGISIRLYFAFNYANSAGNPMNSVTSLIPGATSEFSALAALYDECICDGGTLHFASRSAVAYTTDTGPDLGVVAFDPLDTTALGSTVNGMQHSQHYLFGPAGTGLIVPSPTPSATNSAGLHVFHWRTPLGPARRTTPTTQFGHEWSDTVDTTAAYGYLKWWYPSQGATGITATIGYVTLHMRFRCRS
jgi:hypothetical protein